ncbi:MAG: glycosyltransferase [Acetanaerobacterium sp.]
MRILFLSAANSSHTVKWVNVLAKRGHQILLASQIDHRDDQDMLSPLVRVEYLMHGGAAGYYRNAAQLRELAAVYAPEVASVHYASGYGTLARMARLNPILLSIWGSDVYDFPKKSRLHRRLVEKNLDYAQAVASTSLIMAKEAEQYMKVDTPVFITPFGVDTDLFHPIARSQPNEFVVGTAKRLESECGVDILLKAFRIFRTMVRIREPTQKLRLRIYGRGSRYTPLLGLARELRISEETEFLGQIANDSVAEALSGMDVVCLPSVRESFGVAAVEAMACGRALITSGADGFLETVENDVTGIILKNLDENHLANALLGLYSDPLLRRAMGEAGRRRALALYSLGECAKAMEEALEYAAHAKGRM